MEETLLLGLQETGILNSFPCVNLKSLAILAQMPADFVFLLAFFVMRCMIKDTDTLYKGWVTGMNKRISAMAKEYFFSSYSFFFGYGFFCFGKSSGFMQPLPA